MFDISNNFSDNLYGSVHHVLNTNSIVKQKQTQLLLIDFKEFSNTIVSSRPEGIQSTFYTFVDGDKGSLLRPNQFDNQIYNINKNMFINQLTVRLKDQDNMKLRPKSDFTIVLGIEKTENEQ